MGCTVIDICTCFSCKNPLIVGSTDESMPAVKFKIFVIRPPYYFDGKQRRYPVLFEYVAYKAGALPIMGSSIGDTVFVCEPCLAKLAKGFRKNMAEIFMARLRSRSVSLITELFNVGAISAGPSSAARLKELRTEILAETLSALRRKQKDEILSELISALFESGVIIFSADAKEIIRSLDCERAEFIITGLNALLSDMRNILPSPAIENLMNRLDCVQAFITAPDIPDEDQESS